MHQFPEFGFLDLKAIIGNPKADPPQVGLIPVSKSTWWAGVRAGRYPQPVRSLSRRRTFWKVEDIRKLCAEGK